VTILDVKRAAKVWFGFSDVQWTPAVIERHKDAAYRTKHMACLDVQAWVGSKQHKGAAELRRWWLSTPWAPRRARRWPSQWAGSSPRLQPPRPSKTGCR
jgi:hypothetical protein